MKENVLFLVKAARKVVYFDAEQRYICKIIWIAEVIIIQHCLCLLKVPHKRLQIGGIETRLREFGRKQLGLHKVHPHKFRRTLATMAIDKGMPIEQLQQLLGHKR